MTIKEYEKTFKNKKTKQYKCFKVLKDMQWHCRNCGYKGFSSRQMAGGGGIQGLQRGCKCRPGLNILSENKFCDKCNSNEKWDRWDGTFKMATATSTISERLMLRILAYYKYIDIIEMRERSSHELVVDHRFPMIRWGKNELINKDDMSEDEIERKFQLLKKDSSGNHNLLKSRACERCKNSNIRECPLGIEFFYEGNKEWPQDIPQEGEEAEKGCIGCGWYNFAKWREKLNSEINNDRS